MGECGGRTIAREVDSVGQQLLIGADRGAEGRHQDILLLCDGISAPSHSLCVFKLFWLTDKAIVNVNNFRANVLIL